MKYQQNFSFVELQVSSSGNNLNRLTVNEKASYGPSLETFFDLKTEVCSLLISSHSPYENKARITTLLSFLLSHVDRVVILEGGYLHRWNLECIHAMSAEEAHRKALKRSRSTIRRIMSVVKERGWHNRVEVVDYLSHINGPEFAQASRFIQNVLVNSSLQADADDEVNSYLVRNKYSEQVNEDNFFKLRNYILEEISLSFSLHLQRCWTECYVGTDLGLIRKLVNSKTEGYLPLNKRTFISLES